MSPLIRWVTSGICCGTQLVMTCTSCRRTASWSFSRSATALTPSQQDLTALPAQSPMGHFIFCLQQRRVQPVLPWFRHAIKLVWHSNEVQAMWLEVIQGDLQRCLWVRHVHGQWHSYPASALFVALFITATGHKKHCAPSPCQKQGKT